MFGKPATPRVRPVRTPSINIDWSDSDSSIDSLPPSSPESSGEEWPETTGFHVSRCVCVCVCVCVCMDETSGVVNVCVIDVFPTFHTIEV